MKSENIPLLVVSSVLIAGASCEAIFTKGGKPEASADNKQSDNSGEELASYCKSIREIQENQEETAKRVEELKTLFEGKSPSIIIDRDQKELLRKEWRQIESEQKQALENLNSTL